MKANNNLACVSRRLFFGFPFTSKAEKGVSSRRLMTIYLVENTENHN